MATMTEITAQDFVDRYGVSFDWEAKGYQRDSDGWEHQQYEVTLTANGRTYSTYSTTYRMGLAHTEPPTVDGVLESLRLDIEGTSEPFEEWAGNYGYNEDSRQAWRLYEACRKACKDLYDWCTSEAMWEDLLSIAED